MKKIFLFLILTISIFAYDINTKVDFRTNPDDSLTSSFLKLSSLSNNQIKFTFDKNVNLNSPVNLQFTQTKFIDVLENLTKQNKLIYELINENLYIIYNENDPNYNYSLKQYGNILSIDNLKKQLKQLLPAVEVVEGVLNNSIYVKAKNNEFTTIDNIIDTFNKIESNNSEYYTEKYFELDYQNVEEVLPLLQKYYTFTNSIIDKKNNGMLLRYLKKEDKSIVELINKLDREKSTVLIEVQILEYGNSNKNNVGFKWGEKNSVGVNLDDFSLSSSLHYLLPSTFDFTDIMSNSKILSKPSLLIVDDTQASILVGEQIPIITAVQRSETSNQLIPEVDYKNVGLELNITPNIHNSNNKVTLNLDLSVDSLGNLLETEYGNYYTINTKKVKTQLLLEDKQLIVLGGLISEEERKKKVSVPILGRIPVLGRLFRYDESEPKKTEIILSIKPIIISKSDFNKTTILDNPNEKNEPSIQQNESSLIENKEIIISEEKELKKAI